MLALAFAQIGPLPKHPAQVSLVSAAREVRPGSSFLVALRFHMQPGWHIYWENPGESGQAPTVQWSLPKGWRAGPIEWPTPDRIDTAGIVTYAYPDEALLPVRITVPPNAQNGLATLRARADWLVCREGCVPDKADLAATVQLGSQSAEDPTWASPIEAAEDARPGAAADVALKAIRRQGTILLSVATDSRLPSTLTFFPADETIEPSAPQPATGSDRKRVMQLTVSSYASKSVERLRGLLVTSPGSRWPKGARAISVDIPIQSKQP